MDEQKIDFKHYGWVPFRGFQWIVIFVLVISIILHPAIRELPILKQHNIAFNVFKLVFYVLPFLLIIWFDMRYSSFSLNNLGIPKQYNRHINYILRIIGAYGIIQVLAQDFGIRTGQKQADIVKIPIVQWLAFYGTAFCLTNNRSEAMVGATLYFILKYLISDGVVTSVCFEDV